VTGSIAGEARLAALALALALFAAALFAFVVALFAFAAGAGFLVGGGDRVDAGAGDPADDLGRAADDGGPAPTAAPTRQPCSRAAVPSTTARVRASLGARVEAMIMIESPETGTLTLKG
jgi:hypothetical protein